MDKFLGHTVPKIVPTYGPRQGQSGSFNFFFIYSILYFHIFALSLLLFLLLCSFSFSRYIWRGYMDNLPLFNPHVMYCAAKSCGSGSIPSCILHVQEVLTHLISKLLFKMG